MSTIGVGTGFLKKSFLKALESAKIGDTLVLVPGEYQLPEELVIMNLNICGNGETRGDVVLKTSFRVRNTITLENLTLISPPYKCAVSASHVEASFSFKNVEICPDPAGKKVGVYIEQGTVNATRSLIRAARLEENSYGWALKAGEKSQIHLAGTVCETVLMQNSSAYVDRSTVSMVRLEKKSRLQGGPLAATSFEGKRAMMICEESVVELSHVDLTDPATEIFVSDSFVRIGSLGAVHAGTDVRMTAYVTEGGKAQSDDPNFSIHDPEKTRAPRDILWPNTPGQTGAEAWPAIREQLKPGDTLVLQDGLYVIPGMEDASWNIRGNGRGSVLAANLRYSEEGEYTLSNLYMTTRSRLPRNLADYSPHAVIFPGETAKAPDIERTPVEEHNLLRALQHAKVSTSSVVLDSSDCGNCWAMWVADGGHLAMEHTTLMTSAPMGDYAIGIGEGGVLEASSSDVGTLRVHEGGRVRLHDGTLTYVAVTGGRLDSTGILTHNPPEEGYYAFMVDEDGFVDVEHVRAIETRFSARTRRSHLTLRRIDASETSIEFDGDSEGFIDDSAVVVDPEGNYLQGNSDGTPEPTPSHAEGDSGEGYAPPASETCRAEEDSASSDALAELDQRIGLQKVKEQIRTFMGLVQYNKAMAERGRDGVKMSLHSMFLGNPGTGKTTVARLLARALYEGGVIERDYLKEVSQEDLVSAHVSETPTKTKKVCEDALGGVLFIDEAYALYSEKGNSFGQEAVDTILKFMEDHRDNIVVIFAGYRDKMQDFLGMNPGMSSRIANTFDFEDYSPDEIAAIGCAMLGKTHQFNRELYSDIIRQKYARSSDHSNGRWIRNQNQELLKIIITHFAENPSIAPDVITDDYLYEFAGGKQEESSQRIQELLDQLEGLIGLESVKTYVNSLVKQVQADQKLAQAGHLVQENPTHHMLFLGNPGTGKTTVAQIVAQLFSALGILEKPTVKTATRRDMVGRYIGHTEAQTGRILDEAMGGVLFVDEAYQLATARSENDFGAQAIETLLTALENQRSSFVAIFAGYTEPMEEFLDQNPGLRSRIPHRIVFPDYTPDEIATITAAMLRKNWVFNEQLLRDIVTDLYEHEEPDNRSNARWARNLSESIQAAHKGWIVDHVMDSIDPSELKTIRDEVLQQFAR